MKIDSLEKIAQNLNNSQVLFLVVGGLAVNAHGYVRPTKDIDLVIQLTPENLDAALPALAAAGYRPYQHVDAADLSNPSKRKEWRESKGMVVLKFWSDAHPETPVDVFIEEPFDFHTEYARSKPQSISDTCEVRIVALGTLLKLKETAARPRDLDDIETLKQLHGL